MTRVKGGSDEIDIQFLKELQKQMRYEDECDYDFQANPRFWVIRDYRIVPANEEYDDGFIQYFYSDGDFVAFETVDELRDEIREHFDNEEDIKRNHLLSALMEQGDFEDLWEYIQRNLNDCGCYSECYVKEEGYNVPNTVFLTKKEAKEHLWKNKHHYTEKAHTYAMTAWRSGEVSKVLDMLMNTDWDKVKAEE